MISPYLDTAAVISELEDELVGELENEYVNTFVGTRAPANKRWLIAFLLYLLSRFRVSLEQKLIDQLDRIYDVGLLTFRNELLEIGGDVTNLSEGYNRDVYVERILAEVDRGLDYILGRVDELVDRVDDGIPVPLVVDDIVSKTKWKIKAIVVGTLYSVFRDIRHSLSKQVPLKNKDGRALYGRWDATLDTKTCKHCYKQHEKLIKKPKEFVPAPNEVHPNCRCLETFIYI